MKRRLLILAVVGGIAFGNSLSGPFHYDDLHSVQYNPHIRSLGWIPTYFVDPSTFSGQARGFMYRPLLLTTFALDYSLWGQNATAFRVTNLLIHTAAAAAFGALFFVLLGTGVGASLAALLFLLHPIHTEAVNYISARSDALVALFFFLAAVGALRYRSRWLEGAYAAALLVKSVAITLLPMLVMLRGWAPESESGSGLESESRRKAGNRERRESNPRDYLGIAVLSVVYLGILWGTRFLRHSSEVFPRSLAAEIWTQVKALVYYLWMFISPTRLTVEHPFSIGSPTDVPVLMAIAVVMSVVVLSLRHRLTVPGLAAIWFGVCMLPYSVLPLNIFVAERRVYLASAGLVLLAVWAWQRLHSCRGRQVSWIGVGLISSLLILTVQRNSVWASEISLWSDAAQKHQLSARARVNLALAHRRAQDPKAARTHLEVGLRLDPEFAEGWVIAGDLARDAGDNQAARDAYERASRIQPSLEGVYHNLGNLSYAEGRVDDAILNYMQTLKINPRFAEARNNLGQALEAQGREVEALDQYQHAVRDSMFWIHTDDPVGGAWYNLARLADRMQKSRLAVTAYEETVAHLSRHDAYDTYVDFARLRLGQLRTERGG
ncbi:MAG: tetratricopeptide repeat protein [Gemmatimonadetes bacterium]|nr:tetratricopeptide repeat protein [Gemmatimonadota bacterium]MBT5055929.1 tetratricopeptide repeat protein [Gemmatimonadota bacterium]MBT5143154.1 tetratricopeptide repeat protein [Gemmatimonadota bacterium]MBT5588454.1 tetratricopeptide repeat protein [Gemmatimonadota bacterium]MBT5964822.1 tetratricopeptide repeat protein [Gemmatimonadota bacterium]